MPQVSPKFFLSFYLTKVFQVLKQILSESQRWLLEQPGVFVAALSVFNQLARELMITMILFWSDSTKSCQLDCWKHFQYAKEYLSSGFTAEQSLTKKSRLKKYSLPRS